MKKLFILLLICSASISLKAQSNDKSKAAEKKPAVTTQNATAQPAPRADKKAPGVRPQPIPAQQAAPANQAKPANSSAAPAKDDRKTKKDGTPDRRFKENKHVKKDGTPDKRYKENKEKDKKAQPAGSPTPTNKKAESKK
jgi:hypothetical protein